MICHHPDDSLLLALAAGSIAHGPSVVVSAHIERCRSCLAKFREFEAVGGVLLDQIEPAALSAGSLDRALSAIHRREAPPSPEGRSSSGRHRLDANLPAGTPWPRSLQRSAIKPWRRLGPGVQWSRVIFPDLASNLHLLRVAAGRRLPMHGHRGGELSQVLYGAFKEGDKRFEAGDFIEADDADHHRPSISTAGECICLISLEGHIAFDKPLARLLGSLLGM